jgi:hypothetical protein
MGGIMDERATTELQVITPATTAEPIPAFTGQVPGDLRQAVGRAVDAWLLRTPSPHTRRAYEGSPHETDDKAR